MIIHVVKSGESLYSISLLYNVPYNKIALDNELENSNRLVIGQALVIIGGVTRHIVALGQTFYTIAVTYGLTISELTKANPQVIDPSLIFQGQILNIPSSVRKLGTIEVNGYAFPNISLEILAKTLPNLTYLSIFSYEVKEDGALLQVNDAPIIKAARLAKVAPLLVITNLLSGKGFSSDLAHTILSSDQLQNKLLNNALKTLRSKNYYGMAVDFEYIYPSDRQLYNNFLRKAVEKLKPLGVAVTAALAPKLSADQKGLLYEAHDYPSVGALVSHVILMTYEWGYTSGPPMAVAPINEVSRVIEYAVTAIPSYKMLMGVPNYGYDWTLPYKPGTKATVVSNVGAINIAARWAAKIKFDMVAASSFFNYYDDMGKQHVVWFEDARSIKAKLQLVNKFKLGGVSYWTIGRYFPQNWLVLNSLYNVKKVL